jgi:cytochrome c peroxidase
MSAAGQTVRRSLWGALGLAVSLSGLAACSGQNASEVVVLANAPAAPRAAGSTSAANAHADEISPRVLRRFARLTNAPVEGSQSLVDLGRMLYFEPRLSKTGAVSCNTCHVLERYGTTDTRVSTGVNGQQGSRNAPSTFNAAGHFRQFWDGRSPTVEAQAKGPIQNPAEMGMAPIDVVAALRRVEGYVDAFKKAFPREANPVTFDNVGTAIGAFERGLITPARWDRYLAGDTAALNPSEKEGAKLFANLGCLVCHSGPYIGGSMFEKVGARVPWPNQGDRGRRTVTGNTADDMVFKVPSLRNVAQTGPYFHDGSAATLNQAVRMMAKHQLGIELSDDEALDIEHWLGSLTGDLPRAYITKPALPAGK